MLVVREWGGRAVYPVLSDAGGFVVNSRGDLGMTPGAVLWCRYMFQNTPACSGAGPRSTSNLLRVEVQ